eukprot:4298018-Alexandrium_andersonii.AAC.1
MLPQLPAQLADAFYIASVLAPRAGAGPLGPVVGTPTPVEDVLADAPPRRHVLHGGTLCPHLV